jgi:hypothetical protein
MMQGEALPPRQRPHPVQFEVDYPERLSRVKAFFKWLLVIPHFIAVYLLMIAVQILTVLAWFAILFTGRYPKAFFEFNSGVQRWSSNAFAYFALLRDEYPPFSWEPGEYPLALQIPMAERQSRFRLFIRLFAILPNYIVFYFVMIAWYFTTFIAWWAIVITGRYPRGLFRFSVGVMRWYNRMFAYLLLLRDEYPPYSVNANARPGNEVLSAIIGVPLMALYIGAQLLPFAGMLGDEHETVFVTTALASGDLSDERPSGEANNMRITLLGYDDNAPRPTNVDAVAGYEFVSFRVRAEKEGRWPAFFTPLFFRLHDCSDFAYSPSAMSSGFEFEMYWWGNGGEDEGTVTFHVSEGAEPCDLVYHSGLGQVEFLFTPEGVSGDNGAIIERTTLLSPAALAAGNTVRDGEFSLTLVAYNDDGASSMVRPGPGERIVSFGLNVPADQRDAVDPSSFEVYGCDDNWYVADDISYGVAGVDHVPFAIFIRMPEDEAVCELNYFGEAAFVYFAFEQP